MESPVFETARLRARHWTFNDVDAVRAIFDHPEVTRFLPGPSLSGEESARAMLTRNQARYDTSGGTQGGFALVEKATGAIVGNILLKALPDGAGVATADIEIGWHLAFSMWGRGYATEAARGCRAYGFEKLKLPTIHAVVDPANTRSLAVARRIGLLHRGQTDRYYGQTVEWFSLDRV
jgi:[ribosomal protein S5]-alanine N-acetyltransferase